MITNYATSYSDLNNLEVSDLINDGDVETYYETSSNDCYIGYDFGSDFRAEVYRVKYLTKLGADIMNYLGMVLEISDNGEDWTTIV